METSRERENKNVARGGLLLADAGNSPLGESVRGNKGICEEICLSIAIESRMLEYCDWLIVGVIVMGMIREERWLRSCDDFRCLVALGMNFIIEMCE